MKAGTHLEFVVPADQDGERLDRWLAAQLGEESSRSQLHAWLEGGCIVQAGDTAQPLRKSHRIREGEGYVITVPQPTQPDTEPKDLNLAVVFEDAELGVIVKPPGIAVHPGPGERRTTLINGILHLLGRLPEGPEPAGVAAGARSYRPGIVHRLDRDTEGLLVVARTERALRNLSAQFAARSVEKEYVAWAQGKPPADNATIRTGIMRHPRERLKMKVCEPGRGREAITHYEVSNVLHSVNGRTFARLLVRIETGRTHQIRAQLASVGLPVVGDPLYSRSAGRFGKFGMLLLAARIAFDHPVDGRRMEFRLPEPERFRQFEARAAEL